MLWASKTVWNAPDTSTSRYDAATVRVMNTRMSLPNEITDQLLSGYLDDALSADERARVESMLESDQSVLQDLEYFRELRASLQAIDAADRSVMSLSIGPGLAERIVDLAIEQARHEGVGEDHPLIRSSEVAVNYRLEAMTKFGGIRRIAVTVAALAAMGLVALATWALYQSDQNGGASNMGLIAGNSTNESAITPNRNLSNEIVDPVVVESMVAATEPAIDSESVPSVGPSVTMEPANADLMPNVASNQPATNATNIGSKPISGVPSLNGDNVLPIAVMVFSIKRTEHGRFGSPIRAALKNAGIELVDQRPVTDAIVSSVTQAVSMLDDHAEAAADEIQGSVMYIEAPAKRIDQLQLNLLADVEGIESVEFHIALNTPLAGVAKSLSAVQATAIRRSRVFDFGGELQNASQPLARHLSSRDFVRMDKSMLDLASLAGTSVEDGPDFPSQVFLLVR